MSKNIVLMPREATRWSDVSEIPKSSMTREGVNVIPSNVIRVTEENVGIIGTKVEKKFVIPERTELKNPDNPCKPREEINYFIPWSERAMEGEDCSKYMNRHISSKPVLYIYSLVISTLVLFAALRYRRDDYFWFIFTIGIIWWLFGIISIWYATLHQDIYVGMILSVIFIGLLIVFGYVTLETRRLNIEIIMT